MRSQPMNMVIDSTAPISQEQPTKEATTTIPKTFQNRERITDQQARTIWPEFRWTTRFSQMRVTVQYVTQEGWTNTNGGTQKRTKAKVFNTRPSWTDIVQLVTI